jgi:hypothetical protein
MTTSGRILAAVSMAALVAVAVPQLSRPGYTADEEFTVFAVRGMDLSTDARRHLHLPILPSGLLYDRGLAYTEISQIVGVLAGSELPAFRAVALASAVFGLLAIFELLYRRASPQTAAIAVVLIATSIPFWSAATTARFYAPFFASYAVALLLVSDPEAEGSLPLYMHGADLGRQTGTLVGLFLAPFAILCRLTHELAFTLILIPAAAFVLAGKGKRVPWFLSMLFIGTALVVAQGVLFALHSLAPSSGETMIKRFFLWQVINLFEVPPGRQFGIPLVVLVIAWLIAPRRARLNSVIALCVSALILGFSLARVLASEPFSLALIATVFDEGTRYPLDMFRHIVSHYPVSIGVALSLLVARLASAGGEWRPIERAAHLLWIGWVLWFGVIESGITINYLLLPVSFMLVAIAVDLVAIVQHNIDSQRLAGKAVSAAACVLVIAAIAADQWRGEGPFGARLEAARPTINVPGIDEIRESLQPGDRVVCTDELGCLMLVGRIDAWLALDDYVRERFVVKKSDGRLVGVYTGKPAVFRPADLFEGEQPERTIVVDIFKEYAVGNSRTWLPRALARDGVDAQILLETPQVRVVEISPSIQHARQGVLEQSRRPHTTLMTTFPVARPDSE